jgi:hypothetical protein
MLSVIFKMLEKSIENQLESSLVFVLIKGWLDIMLTKASPKPDNYLTKQPGLSKIN